MAQRFTRTANDTANFAKPVGLERYNLGGYIITQRLGFCQGN